MMRSKARGDTTRYSLDDRLIMPEKRYEVIDGEVIYVPPAGPPHAKTHARLCGLLAIYANSGYSGACDMLTRTGPDGDMAPDGSIYPDAEDEEGNRQLECLAFEVLDSQRRSHAGVKAERLMQRGVRRVFGIDLKRNRCLEWDLPSAGWRIMAADEIIDDECLVRPLPTAALLDAAVADEAVCHALVAKRSPVLEDVLQVRERAGYEAGEQAGYEAGEQAGYEAGEQAGLETGSKLGRLESLKDSVFALLAQRGLELRDADAERIRAIEDAEVLRRWLLRAASSGSMEEVFEE